MLTKPISIMEAWRVTALLDDAAGSGRQQSHSVAAGCARLADRSPLALICAVVLAIYEPWGRIRGDR